jgi:ribose 5-phosphate isomerase A
MEKMTSKKTSKEELKQLSARAALSSVQEDKVLGIGSGSTVKEFIQLLPSTPVDISTLVCIPSSYDTEQLLIDNDLIIGTLNQYPKIFLTVDGADRVDKSMNLIKGGGGAFLQEKLLISAAEKVVIIVDESKIVPKLGGSFPVPVEVIPRAKKLVTRALQELGGKVSLRPASNKLGPTITDNGNIILDTTFDEIADVPVLEQQLNNIPGVIENGLFPRSLIDQVIIGTTEGIKKLLK